MMTIIYSWPVSQDDLDTGTKFLSCTVGYHWLSLCPYMTWNGDDTGSGPETAYVDLESAFNNGMWTGSTSISLYADWYSLSDGSGPATVTVSYLGDTQVKTISPNTSSVGATTLVGNVSVDDVGIFTLT